VCVRQVRFPSNTTDQPEMGLNECRLTCGEFSVLWPKPKSAVLGKKVARFVPSTVTFNLPPAEQPVATLLGKGIEVFTNHLIKLHPRYHDEDDERSSSEEILLATTQKFFFRSATHRSHLSHVEITLNVTGRQSPTYLTMNTSDEAYRLTVRNQGGSIVVNIEGSSYFGVRNGLETLSQLIAYDDEDNSLMIVDDVVISDEPAFPYRGLILDTSRNYIPIQDIKKTIMAMAASKLNTFHWHITDTNSFPFVMESIPEMSLFGAYDKSKIYTKQDIRQIVEFGRVRGVRVLPEFDAPAHVGYGWQWGPTRGMGELAVCVNQEPWQSYCVQPPCGQLNLANPKMYDVLEQVYQEMVESFGPLDLFHYGGDEVNLNCWNSTEEIKNWVQARHASLDADKYYQEWSVFQDKAKQRLTRANGGKAVPGILWTSHLTEKGRAAQYLSPEEYIIQIWTKGDDPLIKELLEKNFRLIFSNYDALYLDCGFGAWVGEGNNWCSPYIGWQKVYDNSPLEISFNLTKTKAYDGLIQGGEAAMWTEQVDGANLHSKVWPRAAALAERLWSNPPHGWELAEHRMIYHRQRLVQRGIPAERLQPEFCLQNEDLCYVTKA